VIGFRLIYEGELLSAQADGDAVRRNKHAIRKQLHVQLKELWKQNMMLQSIKNTPPARGWSGESGLRQDAEKYKRGDYEFIPLVTSRFYLVCSLDILFLRREAPGSIVQGGDIDNRIKTLFDGLRLPEGNLDITETITEDEKPFYCLLQDDRLIVEAKITTDRLLKPTMIDAGKHKAFDVVLVIGVELKQTTRLW
jgi:hypothetical protein